MSDTTEASRDRWKRRAQLFRQGYLDKATEAFALNLQKLQLEAYGADKTLAMQNESLRAGMLKACRQRNEYTRYFRNVLNFKDVGAARESVERINRLYNYFERLGDRMGQHHALVLALTGKNRARWSGKLEESQIFSDWLSTH